MCRDRLVSAMAPGWTALAKIPSPAQRRVACDREQHVGGLGLAVGHPRVVGPLVELQVLEDDRRAQVAARAQRDDPSSVRGGQRVVQADGEREVPEVVGGELHLPALGRVLERGERHHAGVVDEQVQRAAPVRHERGHRGLVDEVEAADAHGAALDRRRGAPSRGGVAHRERDLGAGPGEHAGRLDPDARRAAGDDRAPTGQVDARDDLGGRRVESESGGDGRHRYWSD